MLWVSSLRYINAKKHVLLFLENANPVHANVSTNLFTLPTNSSYLCMEHETDVLIAEDIVLRIMGNTSNPLQVESMGAGANFSKGKFGFIPLVLALVLRPKKFKNSNLSI